MELQAAGNSKLMKIEGSIRSNLISAITSARRWHGRQVHKDTIAHWHAVLELGRRALGEPVAELVADLELELARSTKHRPTGLRQTD
jgi:hypothetical protein